MNLQQLFLHLFFLSAANEYVETAVRSVRCVLTFGNETFVFYAYEIRVTTSHAITEQDSILAGENYSAQYRQNSYCKKRKDESAKHDVNA